MKNITSVCNNVSKKSCLIFIVYSLHNIGHLDFHIPGQMRDQARKIGLFGEKKNILTAFDLIKCLKQIK